MIQVYGGGDVPAYVIDPDTLREELLSEEETREWLEETPDHPQAVAYWRALGELDRAAELAQQQLDELEPFSPRWAAAAVRLAHVHHWAERYDEAHELLDAASQVFEASGDEPMIAFVEQHRAKALMDEGRPGPARRAAVRALELRLATGADPSLLASTRQVLDRIARAD